MTFVQRFGGSSINLNIHLHSLVLDGVYYQDAEGRMRLLEWRGLGPQADPDEADRLAIDQPLLAELYAASVQGKVATGSRVGNYIATAGFQAEPGKSGKKQTGPRCANVSGLRLHANVCIPVKPVANWRNCADMWPARRWPRSVSPALTVRPGSAI